MSQWDIDYTLEKALGQFVLSKSAVSDLTDSLTQESMKRSGLGILVAVRWFISSLIRSMSHCGRCSRPEYEVIDIDRRVQAGDVHAHQGVRRPRRRDPAAHR